jgi:hypothetical protein
VAERKEGGARSDSFCRSSAVQSHCLEVAGVCDHHFERGLKKGKLEKGGREEAGRREEETGRRLRGGWGTRRAGTE